MPTVDYSCGTRCLSTTTKANFALEATGVLRVSAGSAGAAQFSLTASGRARLFINNRLLVEVSSAPGKCLAAGRAPPAPVATTPSFGLQQQAEAVRRGTLRRPTMHACYSPCDLMFPRHACCAGAAGAGAATKLAKVLVAARDVPITIQARFYLI